MKVHQEEPAEARDFLKGFDRHLSEACIGQISEIFDAEEPYTSRGCVAQAWSVAEVLRTWIKTDTTTGETNPEDPVMAEASSVAENR